jgi:hypothetical protein
MICPTKASVKVVAILLLMGLQGLQLVDIGGLISRD